MARDEAYYYEAEKKMEHARCKAAMRFGSALTIQKGGRHDTR